MYLFHQAKSVSGDLAGPWRAVEAMGGLTTTLFPECSTVDDMFKRAVEQFTSNRCLGTRELLREEEEQQPNGRIFKKVRTGFEPALVCCQCRIVYLCNGDIGDSSGGTTAAIIVAATSSLTSMTTTYSATTANAAANTTTSTSTTTTAAAATITTTTAAAAATIATTTTTTAAAAGTINTTTTITTTAAMDIESS